MSWLEKILPKSKITTPRRHNIPEGVWTKCTACEQVLYRAELERNLEVCPKCDHHMRISARARLESFLDEQGRTEIHLPHWQGVEQQHGFVHGGVVGMIADSAAGYAAMTMVPASASVLTVEFKMNLMAPADGEKLIARGAVVRSGRTLIVTQAEVFAVKEGKETLCALMQQTIMVMHGKVEK